jgi:hypothetical protein
VPDITAAPGLGIGHSAKWRKRPDRGRECLPGVLAEVVVLDAGHMDCPGERLAHRAVVIAFLASSASACLGVRNMPSNRTEASGRPDHPLAGREGVSIRKTTRNRCPYSAASAALAAPPPLQPCGWLPPTRAPRARPTPAWQAACRRPAQPLWTLHPPRTAPPQPGTTPRACPALSPARLPDTTHPSRFTSGYSCPDLNAPCHRSSRNETRQPQGDPSPAPLRVALDDLARPARCP